MVKKKNQCQATAECSEMEMDLTDYVMGDTTFLTREKEEKLFAHLRVCPKCRQDLFDWEDTFGMLVSKVHHEKLETKQKLDALKNMLKKEFLPSKVKELITIDKIGETAGDIWKYLKKNGATSLTDLPEKIKRDPYLTILSAGWLAREKKLKIDAQIVNLTDAERKNTQLMI
ncbi:MAG: winged helix-turn-helix domain-containing protein [Planctomycetes bacterium]|nr:winged helix-turn-helix domain-containing protein [Planctomycetota bacterium]